MNGQGTLAMQDMLLKVALISKVKQGSQTILHFRVDSVDKGEVQWRALNQSC